MQTSFDVRIYAVSPYRGARGTTTYTVRWRVQGLRFRRTFTTKKLADGFRAKLQVATQAGEAFVVENGLPVSMQEPARQQTWLDHATATSTPSGRTPRPGTAKGSPRRSPMSPSPPSRT